MVVALNALETPTVMEAVLVFLDLHIVPIAKILLVSVSPATLDIRSIPQRVTVLFALLDMVSMPQLLLVCNVQHSTVTALVAILLVSLVSQQVLAV